MGRSPVLKVVKVLVCFSESVDLKQQEFEAPNVVRAGIRTRYPTNLVEAQHFYLLPWFQTWYYVGRQIQRRGVLDASTSWNYLADFVKFRMLVPAIYSTFFVVAFLPGFYNGEAHKALFFMPRQMVGGFDGTLYIMDRFNFSIRVLSPNRRWVSSVAPVGNEVPFDLVCSM